MKKKISAFILAAAMVLTLAACGSPAGSEPPVPTPTPAPASTPTPAPEPAPAESTPAPEASEPAGQEPTTGAARFAGEYDLYCEEKDMYCEEFVIEEDGSIHGVVESSGLTSFEGTVSEDGTITAEVTRLGGTMSGTISDDLQITVHFEVRGSTSDFVGGPL